MMPRVFGVNALQEGVGAQPETVLRMRVHDDGRGVGELDLLDERRPARHVRDDLVAGAEEHHDGVEERLLAAGGDDDLVGRVLDAVVGLVAGDDRLLQLIGAGIGRVLREVGVDGGVRRRADVLRRRKVRLAGAEIDDVDPLRLERHRLGGDLHRW